MANKEFPVIDAGAEKVCGEDNAYHHKSVSDGSYGVKIRLKYE